MKAISNAIQARLLHTGSGPLLVEIADPVQDAISVRGVHIIHALSSA